MSNIKDTLTNIAGVLGAISGVILAISTQGIVLPAELLTAAGICGALSVGIIGYFTGKAPDGTKKSVEQVADQNTK